MPLKSWADETRKQYLGGMKVSNNCSTLLRMSNLNEALVRNERILPFHKRADPSHQPTAAGLTRDQRNTGVLLEKNKFVYWLSASV